MDEYDPITGEILVPEVQIDPPPTEWVPLSDVSTDALDMSPQEMRALSLSDKQTYLLEVQSYVVQLSNVRRKLSKDVAELRSINAYVRMMDRSAKDGVMTTEERFNWGRERIELAHKVRGLAKSAELDASLGRLVQSFSSVTSALQTCIRAEITESSILP